MHNANIYMIHQSRAENRVKKASGYETGNITGIIYAIFVSLDFMNSEYICL